MSNNKNQKATVRSGVPPKAGPKSGGGQMVGRNGQPKADMLMGLHTAPSLPLMATNQIILPTAQMMGLSIEQMDNLGRRVTAGWMK